MGVLKLKCRLKSAEQLDVKTKQVSRIIEVYRKRRGGWNEKTSFNMGSRNKLGPLNRPLWKIGGIRENNKSESFTLSPFHDFVLPFFLRRQQEKNEETKLTWNKRKYIS